MSIQRINQLLVTILFYLFDYFQLWLSKFLICLPETWI